MFNSLKWSRETLSGDLMGGMSVALVSIPEGMAYALVAGVDPMWGLYTGMVTTIVAALFSSTSLMIVTLTNALALVTGETLVGLGAEGDLTTLVTLTLLVGLIMFGLGALKLGSVIRYVSVEVMSGFVFATASLIVLGQLDELVGYESTLDANKLVEGVDILLNWRSWDVATALVGLGSIGVLLLLKHSKLRQFADILIIFIASIFLLIVGWESVELVGDVANVVSQLPRLSLPDLSLMPVLLAGAVAAAVVGLAESSGVGSAFPNKDGSRSNMSKDFTAQGLGNIAGSFFMAMPAGGSLSRSGLNVGGGGLTRWAGVYSGIILAITVVLFGEWAELIPMSALAALLIVIGMEVIVKESKELEESFKISKLATIAAVITILVGIFDDLTAAIFAGVVLSLLLYAFESAAKVKVVELVRNEQGRWEERPASKELESNEVTVLQIRGNMYFATVYSFADLFPDYKKTTNTAVILRLRDRYELDMTFIDSLKKVVNDLDKLGNKLLISGIEKDAVDSLRAGEVYELVGEEYMFKAEPGLEISTEKAMKKGEEWVNKRRGKRKN